MNTIHFDVDSVSGNYLEGEKYDFSLTQIPENTNVSFATVITIKHHSPVNDKTLRLFPHLKAVITRTTGFNHIDLDRCQKKGIGVYRIPDYGAFNIAEHAMALIFCGARNIISASKETQKGVYRYDHHLAVSLKDKVVGIVGTGRIGREMIRLSAGVGLNILAYDVSPDSIAETKSSFTFGYEYVDLEELLMESDIISLHVPLSPETHHLLNKERLTLIKEGAILVNTSRGEIIDENALLNQIQKFHFVGLDVVENEEDFHANHPLLSHENVVITPHSAFYSDYSIKKIGEETMKLISLIHNGKTDQKSKIV